jgi:PAS domain S-box-containing protein
MATSPSVTRPASISPAPSRVRQSLVSRATPRRELFALMFLWVSTSLLAWQLDLFGLFVAWSRQHVTRYLDALVTVGVTGFVVVCVYAWRRFVECDTQRMRLAATRHELALASERYRSLFDYHPDAVFALSPDGRFVATNGASSDLTGYSHLAMRSMHFTDLIAEEDLQGIRPVLLRVLHREPQQVVARIVHRDGHLVELNVTGVPIVVDEEVVGLFGIAEDITERNRIQRDLVGARQEAQLANEAKSLFLANVSHEIRTPLTSLLGTTEFLQDTELDALQARFVDTQYRSGQRLLRLVNDILDFSKIEAGKACVVRVPFDVGAVVSEVAALVRPLAMRKGLHFCCSLAPDLPKTLVGDPGRLAQVLTNLLDNAIKFTHEGGVGIRATVAHRDAHQVDLVLEVTDSGIGISAEQHDSLFEAFRQGDPSITRKYGGTGLGLAISRQFVSMMGGTITVHSAPGAGSVFRVTLTYQSVER